MKTHSNKNKSRTCGSTLPLMMCVLVLFITMGTGLLSLGWQSRIFAIRTGSEITARTAADAGLTKAIVEMNQRLTAKAFDEIANVEGTDEDLPDCEAIYSYSADGDFKVGYTAESFGESGNAQRKVTALMRLRSLYEYALFCKRYLELKAGTVVDAYNYNPGDPTPTIGTNNTAEGAINLKIGTTINGDVVVGVDGYPDTVINSKRNVKITGETYALTEEQIYPIIPPPDELMLSKSLGIINNDGMSITTSGKYDAVRMLNGKVISIEAPVTLYVVGNIILDNSSQLQISPEYPNASLTLYIGGNVICKNGGFINNLTKDADKLHIYGLENCRSLDLRTEGDFYGAVYVPNADILLHNKVDFFGAVVCTSFIQDVYAEFNYDASLRKADPNDIGVRLVIDRWYEE